MAAIETIPYGATDVEPKTRYSKWRVLMFLLLLGTSYMFNAMDRQVFPALLGSIRSAYGLTLPQGGLVSTIFTINVAIFAALSGWFMAKFGRRHVLLGGLIAYSFFTLATPFASGFVSLTVLRALTGFGEALQVGAVFACIGGYFGANRGAAMGAMQTFFGLGAFLGPVLGTRLEAWANGWEISFYVYGAAGIVMALIAAATLPRDFTEAGEVVRVARTASADEPSIWCRNVVLGSISFGLVGLTFFSYTALYASYLHGALKFSSVDAGSALGMYGIGAMCGVIGGWIGDRTGHRSIVVALLILGSAGYLLFHGFTSFWLHLAMSFVFGLMVSGFLFARFMSVVQRSCAPSKIGQCGAVALAAFYLPGPFAGYLFGELVGKVGWSSASLFMVVVPPIVGALLMSFVNYSKVRQH
ncbi:MFS transporter [Cupriavidus necator]|uniref:MFS transporter n=1 Tax=Cupriavidus necator TaxID=106590 RepID=UPI0005B441F5|nr:MFS transporter [Cupriavidus necator]